MVYLDVRPSDTLHGEYRKARSIPSHRPMVISWMIQALRMVRVNLRYNILVVMHGFDSYPDTEA